MEIHSMEVCDLFTMLIGSETSLYLFDTDAMTTLASLPLPFGPLLSLTLLTPCTPSFFLVHSSQALYLLDVDLNLLRPLHTFQNP
jgi:hypothetical protein